MRRCHASRFGESELGGERPLQVVFYNGDGPYVEPGWHNHPTRKPIVRVDDNAPVRLTPLNRYMPGETSAARKAESAKLVAQFQSGEVARVRAFRLPTYREDFAVSLDGFAAALKRLKAKLRE